MQAENVSRDTLLDLELRLIDPDPEQPRKHFDAAKLAELAESMQRDGLAVPIMVRPVGESYIIVHGERRYRAALSLDWPTIRAEIRDITADAARWLALVENIQRADLSPIEEAHAFKTRLEQMTQTELGRRIGKSQQYIADRIALLRLSDDIQKLITARAVKPSLARRLLSIPDEKMQLSLAKKAARDDLTVKDVEKKRHEFERDQKRGLNDAEKLELMIEDCPDLTIYRQATAHGEIKITYPIHEPGYRLQFETLAEPFTGQAWHWPTYSELQYNAIQPNWNLSSGISFAEDLSVPLFTPDEWDLFWAFDNSEMDFPGCAFFKFRPGRVLGATLRRTYDPNYGRFLIQNEGGQHCATCASGRLFIRRGWGHWTIVMFNNGHGGRIARRVFVQDHAGESFIQQAAETVDPFCFSSHNFNQLALWHVQTTEMSWFYARRKTMPRDDMIAALEQDLDRLRNAQPLSDDELEDQVLDWLQENCADFTHPDWREGEAFYPRLLDGTVDADRARTIGEQANANDRARWKWQKPRGRHYRL